MKNTKKTLFRAILCFAVLACCILLIASCQFKPKLPTEEELLALEETELAKTLMDTSFSTIDYADSYTIVAVSDLAISDFTSKTTVTTKMQGWLKGKFALNYSILNHTSGGNQVEQTKYERGHESGKTYIVPENSDVVIWSNQSTKNFISSMEDMADDDTDYIYTAYEGAATVTAKQNEDKTWTATYTDFSDEWLEKFESLLKEVKSVYENARKLKSVTVTLDVDEELRPIELDVSYKFKKIASSGNAVTVSFNYNMKFSKFDSTTVSSKTFDDDHKLQSLDDIEDMLSSLETLSKKKTGKLSISSDVDLTYKGTSQSQTTNMVLNMNNDSKRLSYSLKTSVDGQDDFVTEYENGKITLNGYDAGSSTDAEERRGINELINIAGLTITNFEKCKVTKSDSDTVYEFALSDPDLSAYSSLATAWEDVEATVKITVNSNGTLKKYEYTLDLSRQGTTVELKYVVTASLSNAQ